MSNQEILRAVRQDMAPFAAMSKSAQWAKHGEISNIAAKASMADGKGVADRVKRVVHARGRKQLHTAIVFFMEMLPK